MPVWYPVLPESSGQPSCAEGSFFCPPAFTKEEGCPMVTYSDLIQIGILIVGIISLFIQIKKK